MARRRSKVQGKSWRLLVASVALGAASLGIASCGFPATGASTDDISGTTAIVECSGGMVTQGDTTTSSLFVYKVPADSLSDTPGGCTVRAK
jgi:hypothetical protein